MKINLNYFIIDAQIDPQAKWTFVFLGLAVFFVIIDNFTHKMIPNDVPNFYDLAFGFMGATAIKCFDYVKLREVEIQKDKELKSRNEQIKCPHCGDPFESFQDHRIHVDKCPYNPKNRSDEI